MDSWAKLYLIEILHQTTTSTQSENEEKGLYLIEILHQTTTWLAASSPAVWLYLIEILHQTTTTYVVTILGNKLYLIEILHQTTTQALALTPLCRCILSKFYIKPQLIVGCFLLALVVSYRNSTSNHNLLRECVNR